MKALVLCAGRGTRLGALTETRPKAMLPIGGAPLLAHTLAWLRAFGYREIGVNLHHHGATIRAHFADGAAHGVALEYREEASLRGTAGAILGFADFLADAQDVLVVYGDLLIDVDLAALRAAHRATRAAATLLLHQREGSNSLVRMADDRRITAFVERPSELERALQPHPWVNSGVQLLSRALLERIPADRPADLPRDLFAPCVERQRLFGFPLSGYRCAIDSPERYAEACRAHAAGRHPDRLRARCGT